MSAATSIIIADGQGTPVNHTFIPSSKDNASVSYQEKTTPHTAAGFYQLLIENNVKKNSPVIRQNISLAVPIEVLQSDGTYKYDSTCRFSCTFLVPVVATSSMRADLYAYAKNLLAHAVVQALVKDLDPPF